MKHENESTQNVVAEMDASQGFNFDLLQVLTDDEVSALERKSIELKTNKTTRKAIKALVGELTLSDAGELAVYMLKKTAQEYRTKKTVDDAIDIFASAVPQLISKNAAACKLGETGIVTAIASFEKVNDAIEALDKWYGPASVNTSDKEQLLVAYTRAVSSIRVYFGPSIQS